MYRKMNFGGTIAALVIILLGCAAFNHKIDQLPIGATTKEISEILKKGTYAIVERKTGSEGVIEVRRYTFNFDVREWDLTFKDDKLIGWKLDASKSNYGGGYNGSEGIGYPCEDPLLGISKAGIFFPCDD